MIYVVLLGAVVAGAFFVVKWYNTNSYFVGVDNNELVVYQGRIGGFLWFHPVAVDRTGVTTAEVPARYLGALDAGVEETSVTSAKCYVANLQSVEVAQTESLAADDADDHDQRERLRLMEKRIRWVGVVMVLLFVALFVQLNNIQVFKSNALANSQSNPRVLVNERSQPRGDILSADGVTLASSVPTQAAARTSTSGSTTRIRRCSSPRSSVTTPRSTA